MVRVLVLKYLNNLSDEQLEYQLLDRMSYQRFCLLADSATIPDRNTIWNYKQRLGEDGVTALFQAVDAQLLRQGYLARCGQIVDATLVPAPIQRLSSKDKEQLAQGKTPEDWSAAKRRQKDLDATHTKKHGKNYHGYKLSISVDVKHKLIRTIGQARATVAMTMMATCYNIKRLVMLLDKQVDAFYRQGETSKTGLRLQGAKG